MLKEEWMFLLTGGVGIENPFPNPSQWLNKAGWDELCRLDALTRFKGFKASFEANLTAWERYTDFSDIFQFPAPWNKQLDQFQKLLILRCLRKDKVVPGIQSFVESKLLFSRILSPLLALVSLV